LRKYRRAFSTPREGVAKDDAIRDRAAQRRERVVGYFGFVGRIHRRPDF
jgi:hypothetical protein